MIIINLISLQSVKIIAFEFANYLYIVQKFITFFIENICFTRIKGLPLRHDSKNFNTYTLL